MPSYRLLKKNAVINELEFSDPAAMAKLYFMKVVKGMATHL